MGDTRTGKVRAIKESYGFIKPDDGTDDVFFLPMAMQETAGPSFNDLREGQAVEFDTIDHPKGKRAVSVRVVA